MATKLYFYHFDSGRPQNRRFSGSKIFLLDSQTSLSDVITIRYDAFGYKFMTLERNKLFTFPEHLLTTVSYNIWKTAMDYFYYYEKIKGFYLNLFKERLASKEPVGPIVCQYQLDATSIKVWNYNVSEGEEPKKTFIDDCIIKSYRNEKIAKIYLKNTDWVKIIKVNGHLTSKRLECFDKVIELLSKEIWW